MLTMQLYVCGSCNFEYNPLEGDVENLIQPGTEFNQLPKDWTCPICGAAKAGFEPDESLVKASGLSATAK